MYGKNSTKGMVGPLWNRMWPKYYLFQHWVQFVSGSFSCILLFYWDTRKCILKAKCLPLGRPRTADDTRIQAWAIPRDKLFYVNTPVFRGWDHGWGRTMIWTLSKDALVVLGRLLIKGLHDTRKLFSHMYTSVVPWPGGDSTSNKR